MALASRNKPLPTLAACTLQDGSYYVPMVKSSYPPGPIPTMGELQKAPPHWCWISCRNAFCERYAAARAAANSISADQSKFIDQTILTLGGGGLGITLTFLHDFVTVPAAPCLLYLGDGLLLLSIMAVLISLYTSQKSISDHI